MKTNPSGQREDVNSGPPDYKSSALTTWPRRLPTVLIDSFTSVRTQCMLLPAKVCRAVQCKTSVGSRLTDFTTFRLVRFVNHNDKSQFSPGSFFYSFSRDPWITFWFKSSKTTPYHVSPTKAESSLQSFDSTIWLSKCLYNILKTARILIEIPFVVEAFFFLVC